MIDNYITNFPDGFTPTSVQADVLRKIQAAFSSGKKFVICSAPTGSGKSLIAKTFDSLSKTSSAEFKRLVDTHDAFKQDFNGEFQYAENCINEGPSGAFVLTITKTLQDQYQKIFSDVTLIKGKSNHLCKIDTSVDVDSGPCILSKNLKADCWKRNICSYYNERKEGLINKFSALNYKMFLALPEHVKYKSFIVCDEASELEEEIVRRFSADIDIEKLVKNGVECESPKNIYPENVRPWLTDTIEVVLLSIEELKSRLSKRKGSPTEGEVFRLKYLTNVHRSLSLVSESWDDAEYIVECEKKVIKLTPLKINKLSHHVFNFGKKILLLSATIIDHKHFAKSLGIEDYVYIEAESQFDPVKSPIYISTKYKLNYKNIESALPHVIKQIEDICNQHENQKGIIHTHTQSICEAIKSKLSDNARFLFREENATNEDILFEHFAVKDPTVLVSPSLSYGIDLKDELARFQIIVKLPYLPLSDKRIKKIFDTDKDWYENRMLNTLVQASGRATRSVKDHSITYILDGCVADALVRTKHKLPKHFLDRIY